MLEDLSHLSAAEVLIMCRRYRADGENRFFPTPGQLMATMKEKPVVPRSNLPKYSKDEFVNHQAAANLKSVAQVLREHGHDLAARKWEARDHLAKTGPIG